MTRIAQSVSKSWPSIRLKYLASCQYGLSQPPEYVKEGIPFIRATNVDQGRISEKDLAFVSQEDLPTSRTIRLKAGDIIVVRSGAYTGDSAIVTKEWEDSVAGFDIVVRVGCTGEPRFVAYCLLSPQVIQGQIASMRSRAAQPHLNAEELGEIEFHLPQLQNQRAIADFLDREMTRLDVLVSAKERLLVILAEKRRAIITQAVTRGLNPNAPLRDSGISWLGGIPAHWEVIALRYLVNISSGATPDTGRPEYWDGDIPWVSPKDMKREEIGDAEDHVTPLAMAESALRLIDPGAVLVVVRGMILAHSFPTAVSTNPVTINQDMKALRCCPRIDPRFLCNLFRGNEKLIVALADCSAHGTRKLETEVLGRFEICVPPLPEQHAIVAYLAAETAKLDALRASAERTIALLKERRSALIAAAVTGQIDPWSPRRTMGAEA